MHIQSKLGCVYYKYIVILFQTINNCIQHTDIFIQFNCKIHSVVDTNLQFGRWEQNKMEQNVPVGPVLYGSRNVKKKNVQPCIGTSPQKYKIVEALTRGLVSDAENEKFQMAKMNDFKTISRQPKISRHVLNN